LLSVEVVNRGSGSADFVFATVAYQDDRLAPSAAKPFEEVLHVGADVWRRFGAQCNVPIHPSQRVPCVVFNVSRADEHVEITTLAVVIHSRDTEPVSFFLLKEHGIKRGQSNRVTLQASLEPPDTYRQ
jgi:hypothetical protein